MKTPLIKFKMPNYKLSIIIVSFNTRETTRNCLTSIYNSNFDFPYEIIVIDNNSHDGSQEMIKKDFPEIKLICNTENTLFAKANNQGAAIAKGDYLLLLNSDTIVYDDNIEKLVTFFDTLPTDVICIGPKVLNKDKTIQSHGFPLPSIRERFCICFKINRILPFAEKIFCVKGLPDKKLITKQVGWVSEACMLVKAHLYKQLGGLNENIEFYGEEPEFGYRSYKIFRYKTFFYSNAEIIHLGGVSTSTIKTSDETRLRRYALLQKHTVGYKRAIKMSIIVLLAAHIKKYFSKNHSQKEYFTQAISWEHKVISYLKEKQNEENIN